MTKTNEKIMINEALNNIVNAFNDEYGFAPAKNKIKLLESFSTGLHMSQVGFAVNGVGYIWKEYSGIEKSDAYDINH